MHTLLPPAMAEPNPTDTSASSTDDDHLPAKRMKMDLQTA